MFLSEKDCSFPSWRAQWHAWNQIAVSGSNTHVFLYKGSCNFATFTKDKEFLFGLLCRHVSVRFSWPCDLCRGLSCNSHFCLKAKHSNSGGYYCHHVPAALLRSHLAKLAYVILSVYLSAWWSCLYFSRWYISVSRTVFQATIHVSFSHQWKQSSSILFLAEIKC